MEEIAEGFGRIILRAIKWFIIEALLNIFVYWYGFVTLKLVTLGQYPKAGGDNETSCILAGMVSIVITLLFIAYFNA